MPAPADVVDVTYVDNWRESYEHQITCRTLMAEWCDGISGMFFGQFPCASCWLQSPASAHHYFDQRTGDQ